MTKTLPALLGISMVFLALPTGGAPAIEGACRTLDENDAMARGHAAVLQVLQGPGAPYTITEVMAGQTGPGMAHDEDEAGSAKVYTSEGDLVKLRLAPARTDVRVDARNSQHHPLEAGAWTTATVLDLDVLDGLVTADVIKAATYATADVRHARTDSGSSEIVGLKVKGIAVAQLAPGASIDLPLVFGSGSFVKVYDRQDDSRFPNANSILYQADVTVRMVHIHLADYDLLALGAQPLEIVVGMSHSYAQAPTPHCSPYLFVGASAYIARVRPEGGLGEGILVGEQSIGPVDGDARQQLFGTMVPGSGETLTLNVTETIATGRVQAGVDSSAKAVAQVKDACLLLNGTGTGECLVSATLVKAESNSYANEEHALSWGHTTLVGLKVAGVDVCEALGLESACSPPMNTKLEIAGIQVVLNQRQVDSPQPGHTGYSVRAVRITAPDIGDVIIARAYTEAAFLDLGHEEP